MQKEIPYKIYLSEDELPKYWHNLRAFMQKKPAPLLNAETLKPMTQEELSVVFCEELVKQELDDTTKYIEIPKEIRDFYKKNRIIILLSLLYGITGLTMNELISICQIEEIKYNLFMLFNTVMPLSLILYLYGNYYFESFNKNNEKVYKK